MKMNKLQTVIESYLQYCQEKKKLDVKTIKAYRLDLLQFQKNIREEYLENITTETIRGFLEKYFQDRPGTLKRKKAVLNAFFQYCLHKELIRDNPVGRLEAFPKVEHTLPELIPLPVIESLIKGFYEQKEKSGNGAGQRYHIRNVAIIELLFSTGIRVSELCALQKNDVDLRKRIILIHGKGSRERTVQLVNSEVIDILKEYAMEFENDMQESGYFFINRLGNGYSEQSVRNLIHKYTREAAIQLHITPKMFRNSFAVGLLEGGSDICTLQEMLGYDAAELSLAYSQLAGVSRESDRIKAMNPRNKFKSLGMND